MGINQMGFITDTQPVSFVHRTFAEYFVARFIIKVLETGDDDNIDNLLYLVTPTINCRTVMNSIWHFVDEYLEETNYSSFPNLLQSRSRDRHCVLTDNELSMLLTWQVAKLLIIAWVDENNITVCNRILHLAVISGAPLNWFVEMSERLHHNSQYELLLCSVENGNYEIAHYLFENCSANNVFDIMEMLKAREDDRVLHFIAGKFTQNYQLTDPHRFVEDAKLFIRYVLCIGRVENVLNLSNRYELNELV